MQLNFYIILLLKSMFWWWLWEIFFRNDDSHFCVTLFRIFKDENSIIFQLFSTYSHTSGNTLIWAKTLINCVWKYTKYMHGYCTFSYHFPLIFMIELMCIFKVPGPIVIMGPAFVIFEKQITDLSSFCPF